MRKTIAILLCSILCITLFGSCFAETVEVESGEIKSNVSDLGVTADFLFKTNQKRSVTVVMLLIDLADKFGQGPLDAAKVLTPVKYTCWIGITDNNKNIIIISPYDEQKSIIAIDYNPKGIIKYYIQKNLFASEQEMVEKLPELFAQYNVTEYYEVTPAEVISAFEQLGITVSVDN